MQSLIYSFIHLFIYSFIHYYSIHFLILLPSDIFERILEQKNKVTDKKSKSLEFAEIASAQMSERNMAKSQISVNNSLLARSLELSIAKKMKAEKLMKPYQSSRRRPTTQNAVVGINLKKTQGQGQGLGKGQVQFDKIRDGQSQGQGQGQNNGETVTARKLRRAESNKKVTFATIIKKSNNAIKMTNINFTNFIMRTQDLAWNSLKYPYKKIKNRILHGPPPPPKIKFRRKSSILSEKWIKLVVAKNQITGMVTK